jgi:hypothetical protein
MRSRHAAALALSALVLVLGVVACGGSGAAKKQQAAIADRVVRQHWRSGIVRWHAATQEALNGISIVFSTEAYLVDLTRVASRTSRSLSGWDQILARCSDTVRALGPVPPSFELAGHYALATCTSLEKGENGVAALVLKLRHGGGLTTLDPLTGAGNYLSLGQSQLTTTMHALREAPG